MVKININIFNINKSKLITMSDHIHGTLHPHINSSGAGVDIHVGNNHTSVDASSDIGPNHTHTNQINVNHNFGHDISAGVGHIQTCNNHGCDNQNNICQAIIKFESSKNIRIKIYSQNTDNNDKIYIINNDNQYFWNQSTGRKAQILTKEQIMATEQ